MAPLLIPGLIAGLSSALAFIVLATLALEYTAQELLTLASSGLLVAGAQYAAVRRHPLGAPAPMFARYMAAALAGAAAAAVHGGTAWLYFARLDPGYLVRFQEQYVARVQETVPPEQRSDALAAAQRMQEFLTDPFSQAMLQAGTVLMIALLTGVLVAAFARPGQRREPGPKAGAET